MEYIFNNTKVHKLKTWPLFFQDILYGVKTFELRKDNRDFKTGDILFLMEFDPSKDEGSFTGRYLSRLIVYKLSAGIFIGIEKGYCILGLGVLPQHIEAEIKEKSI